MRPLFLIFLFLMSFGSSAYAAADCSTPRSAADSLFTGLAVESPSNADFCFATPSKSGSDAERLANQLLQVLDARGLFIQLNDLPNEAQPLTEDGQPTEHVALHRDLPEIYLVPENGAWQYSSDSMTAISELYRETFSAISLWFQNLLPKVFSEPLLLGVRPWQLLWFSVLIFSGLFIGFIAHSVVGARIRQAIEHAGHKMDASLYARVRVPTILLTTGAVLLWGVSDLQLTIKPSLFLYYCAKGMISLAVVLLSMRLIDVFGRILEERAAATEGRMDDQLIPVAIRISKLFAALVGLIFVLQNIGVNVSALIASLGVGGIAVALAAKDTLANVFGSVTIFTDRPFQVGDLVSINGHVGSVEEVGLRSTRIRTGANSLLTVPNASIVNATIDNLGAREFRRVKANLGLTYGTPTEKIEAFMAGIHEILESTEEVRKDNYEVHFLEFGPSSLDIFVNFHIKVDGWHHEMAVRSKINLDVIRLTERLGVDFAFPSQSLYVETLPQKS